MKNLITVGALVCGSLWAAGAAPQAKPQEPGITRQQADDILDELRQIRKLLEKGATPGPAESGAAADGKSRVKIGDSPVLGRKEAPVTMVEFTDYQCTFCQRFHTVTFPEIKKKYIDTGKVRFISRDMPLDFHANAMRAAQAARCAGDQNQFWAMRDVLVANAAKLAVSDIDGYAQSLKLDMTAFQSCLSTGKYAAAVKKDAALASSLRIDGTPAFVIGKSTADGVEGSIVMGALPFDAFEAKLDEAAQ